MNFPSIAGQVIEKLGGKDNISALAHCATRLRIVLKDNNLVDKDAIENIEGVKGQFAVSGQYQIIFGSGTVNKVHAEMSKQLNIGDMTKNEVAEASAEKQNIVQRLIKGLADIFIPIIPAIVAGGLLMGIYSVLTSQYESLGHKSVIELYPQFKDLSELVNMLANAPFVFLPVLLGFSATRKFGGNPFLGAALGMILVHPALTANGWEYAKILAEGNMTYWNVFGIDIERAGYQGTVIPVIIAAWVLATLEKSFRKVIPSSLDNLLTPLLSIFITGFLALTIIGPFGRTAGALLSDGLTWLYDSFSFVGGGVFGAFYAPIVITGMHQTFLAVETNLLATVGLTFIFPIAAMSNMAQGSACLAVAVLNKDAKVRGLAIPSGISAVLGITEPAMFGVNLRYRFPFIAAMIGSGLASAYIAAFGVKAVGLGAAGIPAIPSIQPQGMIAFVTGLAISGAVAFIITLVLGLRARKQAA